MKGRCIIKLALIIILAGLVLSLFREGIFRYVLAQEVEAQKEASTYKPKADKAKKATPKYPVSLILSEPIPLFPSE